MLLLLPSLALAAPARAQADAPAECAIATLSDSVPANGATDVPVDIAPFFVFRGSCGVAAPYTLTVYQNGVAEPVHTEVYDFPAFQSAGESWMLDADFGELLAETAYTVELTTDWGEQVQLGFTTGSDYADVISGGVPGVSIEHGSQADLGAGLFSTAVELTLTSAGRGQGAYVVREGGADRAVVLATGESQSVSLSWNSFERAHEICLTAIERDGIGNWHGPSDETCIPLEKTRGCTHTAPWLAGWMLLPLLGLRRQR
ncbi:MAG: hypothetical protein H6737_12655 [Alphaproteobacteria bacterium]|nr:hypothetical protein [Alphaproteobacteria bacterium]